MAFDDFFRTEYPRIVVLLTAWSGSRSTAEDLAQDAFIEARQRWDRVAGLDKPGAWVRRVALNRSSNERRRRGRESRALQRLAGRNEVSDGEHLPTDDRLWASVRRLPSSQRDATILRYVDDLPLADIAVVLGCAEGTVKAHLRRARQRLAKEMRMTNEEVES